eukprot:1366423-Rhodomonas_salina.2
MTPQPPSMSAARWVAESRRRSASPTPLVHAAARYAPTRRLMTHATLHAAACGLLARCCGVVSVRVAGCSCPPRPASKSSEVVRSDEDAQSSAGSWWKTRSLERVDARGAPAAAAARGAAVEASEVGGVEGKEGGDSAVDGKEACGAVPEEELRMTAREVSGKTRGRRQRGHTQTQRERHTLNARAHSRTHTAIWNTAWCGTLAARDEPTRTQTDRHRHKQSRTNPHAHTHTQTNTNKHTHETPRAHLEDGEERVRRAGSPDVGLAVPDVETLGLLELLEPQPWAQQQRRREENPNADHAHRGKHGVRPVRDPALDASVGFEHVDLFGFIGDGAGALEGDAVDREEQALEREEEEGEGDEGDDGAVQSMSAHRALVLLGLSLIHI